jgi:hypothetical protein
MDPDIKHRLDQAFFTIVKLPGHQATDLKKIWKKQLEKNKNYRTMKGGTSDNYYYLCLIKN